MARKILLADDSVTAQNMGRKILADAGYEVLTVNNGSAALKKIAEAQPELIVLDVYMPGYSGLEVCQRLKEAQETSRIPVLLTVGKLEPFKPEEAKRVRADGYIVKPFEASELLSALSKLEDKIVPRPEAAKPGRFARANAALDEGRFDKTVAVEEDSGWKNRIAFPSKKKKAAEEEDGDDPAIYNAVNKDLRTVVDHKSAPKPQEVKANETKAETLKEEKVNLEALAPEGLPKDVTPEEIAALAAAAAQVKGRIAESKVAEIAPEPPSHADVTAIQAKSADAHPAEAKAVEAHAVEAQTETKTEAVPEAKENLPTADAPKEAEPTAAPVAEQKPEEKIEALTEKLADEKPRDAAPEPASLPVPSPADVTAAITALEPQADKPASAHSGNGSASHEPADEPVTMAMAAGAEYLAAPSRWTAVPVALAADEVAISLELEMQKAHAAFAAAEIAHSYSANTFAEIHPVAAELASLSETAPPTESAAIEPVVQTVVEPEIPSAEAISAAVKELEAVAASYEAQRQVSRASEPAPLPPVEVPVEAVVPSTPEPPPFVEARAEENPVVDAPTLLEEPAKQDAPEPVHEQQKPEQQKLDQPKLEEPEPPAEFVAPVAKEAPEAIAETPETATSAASPVSSPAASPAIENGVPSDQSANQVSSHPVEPAASGEPAAGGTRDMGKKESDIAEHTAAAWASWRRIRETGDSKSAHSGKPQANSEEDSQPRDVAAMAVAAGAEKAPEEAAAPTDADSGEIASIVDSVLAEMRPKIVAEISKKMGKKK